MSVEVQYPVCTNSAQAPEAAARTIKLAQQPNKKNVVCLQEACDVEVRRRREAAERGETEAQFRLGLAYGNGEGAPKDEVEAVKWFRRAAAQGHAGAMACLRLAYDLERRPGNASKIRGCFRFCAPEPGIVSTGRDISQKTKKAAADNADSLVIDEHYPGLIDRESYFELQSGIKTEKSITITLKKLLEVCAGIEAGGSIKASAGIKTRECLKAGGNIETEEGLKAGEAIEADGGISVGWSIKAGEDIQAGMNLRAGESIKAGGDIKTGGGINAGKSVAAGISIMADQGIKAGEGIEAGAAIMAGADIETGRGIKAGLSIICRRLAAKLNIFAGICTWREPVAADELIICRELVSGKIAHGVLKLENP